MNKVILKSESDLLDYLRKVLIDKALDASCVRFFRESDRSGNAVLRISASSVSHDFRIIPKLHPSVNDVRMISESSERHPLLTTVKLTPSLVEACKEQHVSCVDLNGRMRIVARGLLIDRDVPPKNTRYVLAETPTNFFSLKASRLARALLSAPDRTWKQADLVEIAQLSQGLVSRLLNHATQQGWVEGKRGDWRLVNPDALLDSWEAEDNFSRRVVLRQYSTLEPDRRAIARLLIEKTQGDLAFTQWFAASLRFPYADVNVVTAYRRQFLTDKEQRALGYREVEEGGKVWIAVPRDEGVFFRAQSVEEFTLVSDAQIYLDLIHAGLRGSDQAKALRQWKGFCRT